jgi:5-methyltetrahydrofolate--homocysteine methyltransferase
LVNAAQYVYPKGSGKYDAIGVQLSSSGPQVDDFIAHFREQGDSESGLYLQGLSDRIAEDMAEHLHALQREWLGLPPDQGQRWSPGYPGMKNIHHNEDIHRLLDAGNTLGVTLTEAAEFNPTGSTGAVAIFHPDARYQ